MQLTQYIIIEPCLYHILVIVPGFAEFAGKTFSLLLKLGILLNHAGSQWIAVLHADFKFDVIVLVPTHVIKKIPWREYS